VRTLRDEVDDLRTAVGVAGRLSPENLPSSRRLASELLRSHARTESSPNVGNASDRAAWARTWSRDSLSKWVSSEASCLSSALLATRSSRVFWYSGSSAGELANAKERLTILHSEASGCLLSRIASELTGQLSETFRADSPADEPEYQNFRPRFFDLLDLVVPSAQLLFKLLDSRLGARPFPLFLIRRRSCVRRMRNSGKGRAPSRESRSLNSN
jgi:hypothetical protein